MGRGGRGLNEAERQTLGEALRQLRQDNGLTLMDVGSFHRADPATVGGWEYGKVLISPEKALDVLTSLVASRDGAVLNSDAEVINATVAALPSLQRELQLRKMIDQAVADGSAWQHGIAMSIATTLEGRLPYATVRRRLKQAKGES